MKTILKIFIALFIAFNILSFDVFAGVVDLPNAEEIKQVSISKSSSGDIVDNINDIGFSLLKTAKLIISGVLIFFIVYIGIQMIISMGDNDEELGKAKKQIWYSGIGLVFINIPGSIYETLKRDNTGNLDNRVGYSSWISDNNDSNIFIDFFDFGYTFNENIIGFLEVIIFALAIFMITLAGFRILSSAGRDDIITEGRKKITNSIFALIFIGFIEVRKYFAFTGKISDGIDIFETLSNLALFLAGPIAIFFLTLAGYYYITSNGDEERVKKAKSIVVNTVIATVLLLASYTFLLDLADLLN